MSTGTDKPRRTRRSPQQAEAEILDAAESLLREVSFRALSIDELMRRTGLGRSSFYVYFDDRNGLAVKLIGRIGGRMFEVADRWLNEPSGDPVADIRAALEGVGRVYADHGPVLAAIAEAAHHDDHVEAMFRHGLLEQFIVAVAKRLRAEKRAGRVHVPNPAETARALILMNERYFAETLGREPQMKVTQVVRVLQDIWVRALYADAPPSR